jgi:hypothetical protein
MKALCWVSVVATVLMLASCSDGDGDSEPAGAGGSSASGGASGAGTGGTVPSGGTGGAAASGGTAGTAGTGVGGTAGEPGGTGGSSAGAAGAATGGAGGSSAGAAGTGGGTTGPTKTITGAQPGEQTFQGQSFGVYDCSGATFDFDIPEPNYPLRIDNPSASLVEVFGGKTLGMLDPEQHRAKTPAGGIYSEGNGAGVFLQSGRFHLHDWQFIPKTPGTLEGNWDCIRINGAGTGGSVIENIYAKAVRDDLIESDNVNGGTITLRNILSEETYAGLSFTGEQGNRTVHVENVLIHFSDEFSDRALYPDDKRHGPPLKVGDGTSPLWVVDGLVLAFERAVTQYNARTSAAFNRMTATNSWLLFLDHTDPGFPKPPVGFTVLEGAAARAKWLELRAAHPGGS